MKRPPKRYRWFYTLTDLMVKITCVIGIVALPLAFCLGSYRLYESTQENPALFRPATATIVSFSFQVHTGIKGSRWYAPVPCYTYVVAAQSYQSCAYEPTPFLSWPWVVPAQDTQALQRLQQRYRPGSQHPCWVSLKDPQKAFLVLSEAQHCHNAYWLLALLVGAGLLSLWIWRMGGDGSKKPRS